MKLRPAEKFHVQQWLHEHIEYAKESTATTVRAAIANVYPQLDSKLSVPVLVAVARELDIKFKPTVSGNAAITATLTRIDIVSERNVAMLAIHAREIAELQTQLGELRKNFDELRTITAKRWGDVPSTMEWECPKCGKGCEGHVFLPREHPNQTPICPPMTRPEDPYGK